MWNALGRSVEGRPIDAYVNFHSASGLSPEEGRKLTLLVGCTHGDERATVPLLESFIANVLETGRVSEPTAVIPILNPDGYARDIRYNARGADLNRNFPHNWSFASEEPSGEGPLSEPEARLLHDYILALRPAKIVSLHWALSEIDADGPQSLGLARSMWDALHPGLRAAYRLRASQPGPSGGTPGSLGQWCGYALQYPGSAAPPAMVTLELPYRADPDPRPEILPDDHLEGVRSLWRRDPQGYLAGVEGAVHLLLEAACRFEHAGRSPRGDSGTPSGDR